MMIYDICRALLSIIFMALEPNCRPTSQEIRVVPSGNSMWSTGAKQASLFDGENGQEKTWGNHLLSWTSLNLLKLQIIGNWYFWDVYPHHPPPHVLLHAPEIFQHGHPNMTWWCGSLLRWVQFLGLVYKWFLGKGCSHVKDVPNWNLHFFYVLLKNIIGETSNSEFFFPDPTDKKQQKDINNISFQWFPWLTLEMFF